MRITLFGILCISCIIVSIILSCVILHKLSENCNGNGNGNNTKNNNISNMKANMPLPEFGSSIPGCQVRYKSCINSCDNRSGANCGECAADLLACRDQAVTTSQNFVKYIPIIK